jgi:UPF0755 protein
MKKIILPVILIAIIVAAIFAYIFLGPATAFDEKRKYLFVYTGKATQQDVITSINDNNIIKNSGAFAWLANRMNLWKKLKPGRYEIKKGESLLSLVRMQEQPL